MAFGEEGEWIEEVDGDSHISSSGSIIICKSFIEETPEEVIEFVDPNFFDIELLVDSCWSVIVYELEFEDNHGPTRCS
jgi:hypothetical protein